MRLVLFLRKSCMTSHSRALNWLLTSMTIHQDMRSVGVTGNILVYASTGVILLSSNEIAGMTR